MSKTLTEKLAELSAERRQRVENRTQELIAEEYSLRDLRKAMEQTQVETAKILDVGQDTVSRIEQRTDMLLSTLRKYVAALNGQLELVVRFPNRPPMLIAELGALSEKSDRSQDESPVETIRPVETSSGSSVHGYAIATISPSRPSGRAKKNGRLCLAATGGSIVAEYSETRMTHFSIEFGSNLTTAGQLLIPVKGKS